MNALFVETGCECLQKKLPRNMTKYQETVQILKNEPNFKAVGHSPVLTSCESVETCPLW